MFFGSEDNILPLLALEVVSKTYGGEYERKKERYADLGIFYYVTYMPNGRSRRKRQVLEIYQLVDGDYKLMEGSPVWLPEVGLGLGRERGTYLGRQREWLYWYDESGQRLCTPEEKAQQAESKAQQAESKLAKLESKAQQAETKAAKLAQKLKELGVDPDTV